MPKKIAKTAVNTALNEFVYTILYNSTMEQRRGLKGKFQKMAMSATGAKAFASNSTREEKECVMSHFGFEFGYFVFKKGATFLDLKHILQKFEQKKKAMALADIAQEGLFVTTDKEFVRMAGLMSQTIHHPVYFLNLELVRQGYHIQKWSKIFANQSDLEAREVDLSAKLVVKTCLSALLVADFWKGSTGMEPLQIKILLLLYTLSHLYVPEDRVFGAFAGIAAPFKFKTATRRLMFDNLILRNAKEKSFTITGQGIRQINEFIHRTLNLNTY